MAKFRLSNHRLMIEIGRHQNVPKELRFCPFCPNMVETEAHFLFYCSAYNPIRDKIQQSIDILNPNFKYYSEEHKMKYILSDIDYIIVNYIVNSLELRHFLITKHRMKI